MTRINIICVGGLKEKYLKDACSEYIKRLGPFCKLSIMEVDEYKISDGMSKSCVDKALMMEGKEIISKINSDSFVVSLCIEGKMLSSKSLADKLEKLFIYENSNVTFVIGGSYGLSEEVKDISDFKLSLSSMTFPHQLTRVILLEQIYRVFQILSSGKYHK